MPWRLPQMAAAIASAEASGGSGPPGGAGRGEWRLARPGDAAPRDAGDEGPPFLDEGADGGCDLRVVEADAEHVEGQKEEDAIALQLLLGQFEPHSLEDHRVGVLRHRSAQADAGLFPGSD